MNGADDPGWLPWLTVGATFFVVTLLLWRVWPVMMGAGRKRDSHEKRMHRWNDHLVRLLRKNLGDELLVARAALFRSEADDALHSLATWSMQATLIPDVQYIALARPGSEGDGRPEVKAVAEAEALRELLGASVHEHDMWGHRAWLYAWPREEADLDAIVERLTPIDVFRAQHGLAEAPEAEQTGVEGPP